MPQHRTLILDTGPLWEHLLYSAVSDLGYKNLRRQLQYLQSREQRANYSAYIARFRKRVTTPHVVSEISNKIVREVLTGRSSFWGMVFDEFTKMGMDEHTLKLLEMPLNLLASLGAADVSLLKVAQTFEPGTVMILSVDKALISQCNDAGLSAMHLWEVVAT